MAIDKQKLLPGYGALVKKQQTAKTSNRAASAKKTSFADNLKNIETNFINIEGFLNYRFKSDSKQFKDDVRENNVKRRNLGFENKALLKNTGGILNNFKSGLNIRDTIGNFLSWTIAGYIVDKLFKYLPDIINFIERMKPVYKFLEEFAGNVFKGVVDFIDFGYDAYKTVKDFALDIVPDDLEKKLGDFDKHFNTFMNLAFIATMLGTGGSGPQKRQPRRPPTKPRGPGPGSSTTNTRLNSYLNRSPQFKYIQNKYGYDAARFFQSRREQGRSISGALNDVRSRFQPVRATSGLNPRTASAGRLFNRGLTRTAQRTSLKLLGRTGTTLARGVFKRIPIIGGLIDFVFSLLMGEPVGRAAAKAIGATIGAALGTFIPIPFAGTILGGILGDIVGGALYDTISGMFKKSRTQRTVSGSARGGVTSTPQATSSGTPPTAERQQPAQGQTVSVSGTDADFWTLVAIASREDGDPQGWADVAQSIYNRAASGRYGSKNIRELILSRSQYAPTWEYPYIGTHGEPNVEWKAINTIQAAAAATRLPISKMREVAEALVNSTYQEEARRFIGGRTDFKAADIRFPGSIQRKAGDNNFGWQWNYRGNIIGKPLKRSTSSRTPAGPDSITPGTERGSGEYRDPRGRALLSEYVTGDSKYIGDNQYFYGSDVQHGYGSGWRNYHDHYGFINTAARDAAIAWMRKKGWIIGSIDRNRNPRSLHDQRRAFDIPMLAGGRIQKGFEDSLEGQEAFSAATRRDMRAGGFLPPAGIPFKEGGYMTRNRIMGLNSMASYDDVEVQYIIQPIVNTKIVHRTSIAPMSMGAPSGSRNYIRNTFKA